MPIEDEQAAARELIDRLARENDRRLIDERARQERERADGQR